MRRCRSDAEEIATANTERREDYVWKGAGKVENCPYCRLPAGVHYQSDETQCKTQREM